MLHGDDLFGELQANFAKSAAEFNPDHLNLFPDVAVGRVPASDAAEVATYVAKVIAYEQASSPSWFKRALLVTGDYPGSNATNDAIGSALQPYGFTPTKLYHDAIWPTTTAAQRIALIEGALNAGVGLVSYVGHGSGPSALSHDGGEWGGWYYTYAHIPFLTNADKLPVVFSAACETGMFNSGYGPYMSRNGYEYRDADVPPLWMKKFRSAPEPLAVLLPHYDKDALSEHFLVKSPVGAIAFIGAYTGTQDGTHALAKYFFEAYGSTHVIGDMWNAAIKKFVQTYVVPMTFPTDSWAIAANYHHIHKMLLFGDPSLRLGGLPPPPPPCVHDCDLKWEACMDQVGEPGAYTAAQCMERYNKCKASCSPP